MSSRASRRLTGRLSAAPSRAALLLLSSITLGAASCAEEFDTTRQVPTRGSVGEEMFGVLCDRVGAQALREDLTGASYRQVCHRPGPGKAFADRVDTTKLPTLDAAAVDEKGKPVPLDRQKESRRHAIARIEAMGRRRADVVRALDATFPEEMVATRDLGASNPKKSCEPGSGRSEEKLTIELADMLGRMGPLYNDGTLPESTRSLGRVVSSFRADPGAQAAWRKLSAREGYRPLATALGAMRPAMAYPRLRDLSNATLRLLSRDSLPYEPSPKFDERGRRVPVPGIANRQFDKLLEVAHEELLAATPEETLPALTSTQDPITGRTVLNRGRTTLEAAEAVVFTTNDAFVHGSPNFIVRRDRRGYAAITGGLVPAPFVDANGDGLPDVDEGGHFVTADGSLPPAPFFHVGAPEFPRDTAGRALLGTDLLYSYVDTSRTFASQMLADMRPLVNPEPAAQHETMMDALAGLFVMAGTRDGSEGSERVYGTGDAVTRVRYDAFRANESPALDFLYASLVILGDKNADPTLALLGRLVGDPAQTPRLARLTKELLAAREIANAHPEAVIPKNALLWDEILDAVAKMAKVPGLLEDVLRATGSEDTVQLGTVFSRFAKTRDVVTYNRNAINGVYTNVTTGDGSEPRTPVDRAAAATGDNRSGLHRFLTVISDARGVTACNKPNAKVHGRLGIDVTLPIGGGTYRECEVFKIDDLASFYIDTIVNDTKGELWIRDPFMRNGTAGLGAASVGLMEDSSGITGFWDGRDSRVLAPKPEYLNRLVFFDLENDSPNDGGQNYRTNRFVKDLNGPNIGSAVCPERLIDDPCAGSRQADCGGARAKVASDGKVHGLRSCADGDWMRDRVGDSIFLGETFGMYRALSPMIRAFAAHDAEGLFLDLAGALGKHWAGDGASAAECKIAGGDACPRTGTVTYEPLLGEVLATNVLPALAELVRELDKMSIRRCEALSADKACLRPQTVSGVQVLADATRSMVDPTYAKDVLKLKDRLGNVTAKRNDGTTNPQVTPVYLLTGALAGVDDAFETYAAQHPDDADRLAQWRRARSQLVDQFLAVDGDGAQAAFRNPTVTALAPTVVELLRSQLLARCPETFSPPYPACTWATETVPRDAADSMGGPLFAAALDLADAVRRDDEGRRELERMMTYMLDAASANDALASVLASTSDLVQILRDDENIVPFFHLLAEAVDRTRTNDRGEVVQTSVVDAQMALLARMSGKAFDGDGVQICAKEIDPNQVLQRALGHLVTPMDTGETPLEVLADVVADVNRVDPSLPNDVLTVDDYGSIALNVEEFLLHKERGLEQLYEVIRKGTNLTRARR